MHQGLDLRLDRLDHVGMPMPQVEYADTPDEVDIVIALFVPDLSVAASVDAERVNDAEGVTDVWEVHVVILWEHMTTMRTEPYSGLQTKKSVLSIPCRHGLFWKAEALTIIRPYTRCIALPA